MRGLRLFALIACSCTTYGSDADSKKIEPDAGVDAATTGSSLSGPNTGLPCDVQAVLENRCIGCHSGSAPPIPPLRNYGELVAPSTASPAKTRAELALERMRDDAKPMPPAPANRADADEIAPFESWVKVGMPKNPTSCTPDPSGGADDAGALTAPPSDGGAGGCTSGTKWTKGNTGSLSMHPGGACIACHTQLGGPSYRFAGTVYRGLSDVDDCNGTGGDNLYVVITGSGGAQQRIQVASNGNFVSPVSMTAPYSVQVTNGSNVRKMQRTITGGDCNSCHTATGANGAPGRVLAP